jgi:hypothetical protein
MELDPEFWSRVVAWIPAGIVVPMFIWVHYTLWRDAKKRDAEWDEEEKRQQRVKNLYPDQPSYEERMGVQYGSKQDE